MITPEERQSKIWSVVRVSSGNFLEMYDFMVFGYYASAIGRAFFPSGSAFVSLMLSLMTFGAGFLMRPLGALVLGAYTDRHGRRAGLLLTLGLMSFGIFSIACVPGYATIGFVAPLIVLTGRLLQGFSAGMELGGVSVYLSEIATPGHKGFYVSWQSGSQQVAVMFAASVGVVLNSLLPAEKMQAWGWRIPLLLGCFIIPFLFRLRKSLAETDEFLARKHRPSISEILRSLESNWAVVLVGTFMVTMTTVSFYMITAYTPTFGSSVLRLSSLDSLVVTLCVGAGMHHTNAGHRIPGDALAGEGPFLCQAAERRALAILYLRQLQRSHGRFPDGNYAGRRKDLGICAGLQLGDRHLRRLHSGAEHVLDSYFRQSRNSRVVAVLRGGLRASGNSLCQTSQRGNGRRAASG